MNIVKMKLSSIEYDILDKLNEEFNMISSLLDGKTELAFYISNSLDGVDCNQQNMKEWVDSVIVIAATTENAEYILFNGIEAKENFNNKNVLKNVINDLFYDVQMKNMPLMTDTMSKSEKKLLVPLMEYAAKKYGVYVMEEKEYLEMRFG